ncbi:MAG TPA: serine/threonine-protein kinase [Haliangiales bacterium]|nr:serine/threonine-protein kinase [Haliangiales bacterium]
MTRSPDPPITQADTGAAASDAGDPGLEPTAPVGSQDTTPPSTTGARAPFPPGAAIGPFVVEKEVGAGGMGVVYAAHDPALDRKVAIKLLRPDLVAAEPRRARLLREAQALAKLTHPNVMTVYQVGTVHDQVFLAMEFVDGETLRDWLRRERPPFHDVVRAFVRAGRGLAAAHRAGLVHRDFKPENVLRGRDGRVLVTDFGLVGVAGSSHDGADAVPSPSPSSSSPAPALHTPLTQTGQVLGTPRYMAPEQHEGRAVDARADQFAFAVALYEALYGRPPFEGRSLAELRRNVLAGNALPPPRGRAPRWIAGAIARALAVEPDRRFPDMDALLDRLERGPLVTPRRAAAAAAIAAAAGVLVWALGRDPGEACRGAAAKLAGAWDPTVREHVRAAFAASGRPYAEDTFARVARAFDDYAAAWAAMRVDACRATAVRHEQSSALMDLRMACLDRRLGALRALGGVLARADAPVVDRAVAAAAGLDSLDGCADAAALAAAVAPPTGAVARDVDALRARLDEAQALLRAGRTKEAYERLLALAADARGSSYRPLLADVLARLGGVQVEQGNAKAARATLEEAMAIAAEVKDDVRLADAQVFLLYLTGVKEAHPAEALAMRPAAEAAVRRAGGDDAMWAQLHQQVGNVMFADGKVAEAAAELGRALALREKARGPDSLDVARTLGALARVEVKDGKFDQARAHLIRAREIVAKVVGPDHADVGQLYTELGNAHYYERRWTEALEMYQRALAVARHASGEDSGATGAAMQNVAMALDDVGRHDEALATYLRALAIREKAIGPDHPDIAATVGNIGVLLVQQKRLDEARPYFERALAIREKAFGPDHVEVATSLLNLGQLLADSGRHKEGIPYLERALALRRKGLRRDHPQVISAEVALAYLYIDVGRGKDALPLLEEALAALGDKPAYYRGRAKFGLARALVDADRARAVRWAIDARDELAALKEDETVAIVDEWLRHYRVSSAR